MTTSLLSTAFNLSNKCTPSTLEPLRRNTKHGGTWPLATAPVIPQAPFTIYGAIKLIADLQVLREPLVLLSA